MNLKKMIVALSLLLLSITFFTACETTSIEDDERDYNLETQSTNKEDIGNSGNNEDEDYN